MKKVCIITNIPAPYRVDLFNFISNKYNNNYEINVIYSSANEDNRGWNHKELIHNYSILKSKTIKIRKRLDYKYIHLPVNILEHLNKLNPDIVIASEYNPTSYLAYKWSKFKKKKFISWSDGTLNSEKQINLIQKLIRKDICKHSDAFIASSTRTKEAQMFYGADKEKIFISYLTVDIESYYINRKDSNINEITFVGRLVKLKGVDLLIEALSNIKQDFILNIIGDGPELNSLMKLCIKKNIASKVIFHGSKEREFIKETLSKSNIFVLPSTQECFGLVISEAMCAGIPIVVSKYVGGAYDLVVNGENGFIVDPYDELSFTKKLELLLNDKRLNNIMGKKSKEFIQKFSFEEVAKEFVEAIEYIIN